MSESHESVAPAPQPLNPLEAEAIATLGYIYGYPLVLMDVSRAAWPAPVNQFDHMSEFPDDKFTDVVSPNVDTLYSIAWLDLGKEPIVLGVPDLGRRYYTMQLLDAWSNVIASPGTRTTGNGKGAFAIVGPGWRGELPSSVEAIQAPTNMVWLIGRTYTAGKTDYDAVHAIQRQYQLVPLGAWAKPGDAPATATTAPAAPKARGGRGAAALGRRAAGRTGRQAGRRAVLRAPHEVDESESAHRERRADRAQARPAGHGSPARRSISTACPRRSSTRSKAASPPRAPASTARRWRRSESR